MDRFSYRSLSSVGHVRARQAPHPYPGVVPFGLYGAGQWTGHWIGAIIAASFVVIALVGIPGSFYFLIASLALGAFLGYALFLWHRSKSSF